MPKSEVKVFRVSGEYMKNFQKHVFSKEKRALKEEDAVEDVISEITSIGLLRRKVKITEVKELSKKEITDLFIMQLIEDQ
ncbi:MAG: 50S ribosomal protein L18a [Candidatus Lokiarchaeota archaeon]|nr:50S ribosomal protein L18a [Candidatus Lokiarchaeota archaeon]